MTHENKMDIIMMLKKSYETISNLKYQLGAAHQSIKVYQKSIETRKLPVKHIWDPRFMNQDDMKMLNIKHKGTYVQPKQILLSDEGAQVISYQQTLLINILKSKWYAEAKSKFLTGEDITPEAKLAAKEKELAAAKHEIFCLNMKLTAEEILRVNYQRKLPKLKRKLETEEVAKDHRSAHQKRKYIEISK